MKNLNSKLTMPDSTSENDSHLVTPDELPEGVTLREHVYDGIQEYDQRLPNWWLFTFYGAIVWFVLFWFIYYQTPFLKSDRQKLETKLAVVDAKKSEEMEKVLASLDNEALRKMSQDASVVQKGKEIFSAKCVACHGADLSATLNGVPLPGLPLNDNVWKFGYEPMDVFNLVTNGSPDPTKGMIAWKAQLGATDILQVVSFVLKTNQEATGGAEPKLAPDSPKLQEPAAETPGAGDQ